jgi:hypothetical protein
MGRGFLAARGMAAKPPGEETEPAVAGGRSSRAMRGALRSDMRHRDRVGRALRTERTDMAMADQRHSSLTRPFGLRAPHALVRRSGIRPVDDRHQPTSRKALICCACRLWRKVTARWACAAAATIARLSLDRTCNHDAR